MFIYDFSPFSLFFRHFCVWFYSCFVFASVRSLKQKNMTLIVCYVLPSGKMILLFVISSPKVLYLNLFQEKLLDIFPHPNFVGHDTFPVQIALGPILLIFFSLRSAYKRATIFFRLYIFAHVFRASAYWARKYTICYQVTQTWLE